MTTTIGSIYWLLFISFEVWRNWYIIVRMKKRPNYDTSKKLRVFAGAIGVIITCPHFDPLGDLSTWIDAIKAGAFEASSFYLLFDPSLSKLRGLAWNYQGLNSGAFDRLPKEKYYAVKVFSLIVFVVCVINSFYSFI